MNPANLIQAFDRAKDLAREAWSADEVVKIIEDLEAMTLDYVGKAQDGPIHVGSLTKWG